MSSIEESYKEKLLNNKFIEEDVGWIETDNYYCENKDLEAISFLKNNMDSDFSIKNIVYTFYQILRNRYHNNFYLEVVPSPERIDFILRGQPIFEYSTINLVVKYSLTIDFNDCCLKTDFLVPLDSGFDYEKSFVENFVENNVNQTIDDNSGNIKILIDSISLRNYVNKINEHKNSGINNRSEIKGKTEKINIKNEKTNSSTKINESLIYCPNCGEANYPLNRECQKCKSTLLSYMINYGNEITSYDEIVSQEAIKRIEKTEITPEFYDYVLKTISDKCKKISFTDDINVYDKIVHIARQFVDVQFEYKTNPNMYGIYRYDLVHINSNKSFSQQCASLIRYLSVEIHLEVMEALFMYIFDVKNNAFVRNFIDFCRSSNINEEIIHTFYPIQVESYFIPPEYHSYDRINELLDYISYKEKIESKQVELDLIVGNTFAQDIIKILGNIISEDMKKELAEEYEFDGEVPTSGSPKIDIKETLKFEDIINAIKNNMIETIKIIDENENIRKELYEIHKEFEGKESSI